MTNDEDSHREGLISINPLTRNSQSSDGRSCSPDLSRSFFGLLLSSFVIRHSSFVIPLLGATAAPSSSAPDIRAIVPPQPYFLKGSVLWLLVAAASLLLAGLVAWYLLRRPRAPKPAGPRVSPRDAARQRLAELAARADALDARSFGGEVCDILRMYIADEYHLQPQRQTSPEFLSTVAASRVFSRREHTLLTGFLENCDLLKFARLEGTPAGKRALLEQAGEFLDGRPTEPSEPPPLPPADTPPPLPPVPAIDDEHRWQPPAAVPPLPRP